MLAAAGLSLASGFAQFSATATLGDVAAAFGETSNGTSIIAQAGLAGSTLGIGLAIIRLASLGALPLAELADRRGRRGVLLGVVSIGLALTAAAALAPTFWTLVAILALSRPLLSATNAVAGVVVAEETGSGGRTKAIGLISAAYGLGAGLTALIRTVGGGLSFRWVFALALVPLLLIPLASRPLHETTRYAAMRRGLEASPTGLRGYRLGHIPVDLRKRLMLLAGLSASIAFVSGPVNGLLFVYAERIVGLSTGTTALTVLAAGPIGLVGLLVGRYSADHWGRRVTAGVAQAIVATAGIITYAGGGSAAIGGYLLTIAASAAFGPAAGAMAAELFPTTARATAAGWLTVSGVLGAVAGLVVFGTLADVMGFSHAALVVCVPVALLAPLYFRLNETRGMELQDR